MPFLKYCTCIILTATRHLVLVPMNWVVYDFVCSSASRYGRACGTVEKVSALVHSPPLEGWQAKPDGVVVKVLNNVTPIDLLAQSAVLFFNSPMLALPYKWLS